MYGLFFGPDLPTSPLSPPYAPPQSSTTYPVPPESFAINPPAASDDVEIHSIQPDSGGNPPYILAPVVSVTRQETFVSVGTSMLTAIVTWLGGLLAVFLYRTQQESTPH
jgi:hypothetical protein